MMPYVSTVSMMGLFDQSRSKLWKFYGHIWFFLKFGLPWIILRQWSDLLFDVHQWPVEKNTSSCVGFPFLTMVDLSGNKLSWIFFGGGGGGSKNFDNIWCVKGLIVSHSNLMDTGKLGAEWALFLKSPCFLCFAQGPLLQVNSLSNCAPPQKKKKRKKIYMSKVCGRASGA